MAAARFYMIFDLALMMILGIDCVGNGKWSTVVALRMSPERELRPRADGATFKVGVFADLHFGENAWTDWGPKQDVNSVRVMEGVLDVEKPEMGDHGIDNMRSCMSRDFVVYLGDLITANNMPIANASQYWDMAISPTRARGIPWASVFGNHDDAQFVWPIEWFSTGGIPPVHCSSTISSYKDEVCSFIGTSRLELIKREIGSSRLSLSNNGPRDLWPSVSNYALKVSSDDDSESPLVFLYFLDSGGGSYPEVISSAQVEWFKNKSQKINPDSRVPEIIFWHIPGKSYNNVAPWFMILKPCVGSINKEKVAPQEAENGMMNLLTGRPSVKAVFVGHNHGLDWCCPYKKLWLCYARHTGYGGYGNWPRGARIIEITERPFSLKSWIRMEDGSVHSQVTLSS